MGKIIYQFLAYQRPCCWPPRALHYPQLLILSPEMAEAAAQEKKLVLLKKEISGNPQVGIDEARRLLKEIHQAEAILTKPLVFTDNKQADWVQATLKKTPLHNGWKAEQEIRELKLSYKQQTKTEHEDTSKLVEKIKRWRMQLGSVFASLTTTKTRPLNRDQKPLDDTQEKELSYLQAAANID